jgi:hypothetical protein
MAQVACFCGEELPMRRFVDQLSFQARVAILIITVAFILLTVLDDPDQTFAKTAREFFGW